MSAMSEAITIRTRVGIIGAGPSGLLLSQILHLAGIDSVVLERRRREHVLGRVRAGVLEQGTVEILERAGVGGRLNREGLVHQGVEIYFPPDRERIDFSLVGASMTVYGQTEITKDLFDARDALGATMLFGIEDVALERCDGPSALVTFTKDGRPAMLECDFVAGCDGFHGVSRRSIPAGEIATYERTYPFGWLGLLADAPPVSEELVYSSHERGFALFSMRSPTRSRCYIQCGLDEDTGAWSDTRFWDEFRTRMPPAIAERLEPAPSIEKSVAPLRSFVCEPMSYGRLFLAGDAAHIVPPTGAKGLNLAVHDVHELGQALIEIYRSGDHGRLSRYSQTRLAHVWRAERFSAWLTCLLHTFPGQTPFDRKLKRSELEYLAGSEAARASFIENYAGLRIA